MTEVQFTHDFLVFVGRFQPLHNGHMHVINRALKCAHKIIILVGSSNIARSPRNPFSFAERKEMILDAVKRSGIDSDASRILVLPLPDFSYNDAAWIAHVQRTVNEAVLHETGALSAEAKVGLIGHRKDGTSYYLKMFPGWSAVDVRAQHGTLNSTDLRVDYLRRAPRIPSGHLCPQAVIDFFARFMLSEEFKWLLAENEFYKDYKAAWGRTPYPVFVNCVDAIVIQSGHVLVIERAHHPGKGLMALPGGHVSPDETFRAAAIRELREETRISDPKGEIPPAMLDSFIDDAKTRLFDDPYRSERGRVVTQAFLFNLPSRTSLFSVRGDDDAATARWVELGRLKAEQFFEDHASIIREMTGALID